MFLISATSFSQNTIIDSLLKEVKRIQEHPENFQSDTTLLNTLNRLSREMIDVGSYTISDSISHEAIRQGDMMLKRNKGVNEYSIRRNIANSLRNIGIVSEEQGNYPKALEKFFASLTLNEKIGYKRGIAGNLISIGIVYKRQNDPEKALRYYMEALRIVEEAGITNFKGLTLVNIGNIYADQKQFHKALEFYFKALVLNEKLGNTSSVSTNLGNIGIIYKDMGEYSKALEYYNKAIKIAEENGNKQEIGRHTGNIGSLYMQQKKFSEAEGYLKKALLIATEIGDLADAKEWHQNLSSLYESQEKWALSLEHHKKYIIARDSIYNGENTIRALRAQMNFDYEKRVTADSVKNAENKKVEEAAKQALQAQLGQERTQRYSLYGGLFLVIVFAGFLFNRFKVTRAQNRLIEQQKQIVEKKNKEVIDSINYARRIQEAILKEEEHVTAHLPEHFVLFKPKDIVSGDFYWSQEKKQVVAENKVDTYWYLCVADCTGHGVPGAFMSMLGTAYLNEINTSESVLSPAEILDRLREKIVKELKQSGEMGESKDGMDISMMRYNIKTKEVLWAGANNPLWISRKRDGKQEMKKIKADKQPIGYTIHPKPFTDHSIAIEKGDTIYLFSDGYADQFGGPNGKKFKYKQLEEQLIEMANGSMSAQKDLLIKVFEKWRGGLEQVDDVAMIGVRF